MEPLTRAEDASSADAPPYQEESPGPTEAPLLQKNSAESAKNEETPSSVPEEEEEVEVEEEVLLLQEGDEPQQDTNEREEDPAESSPPPPTKPPSASDIILAQLREGTSPAFDGPEEVARARRSPAYRLRLEHAWCGRVRPTTKLRLTWHVCFGTSGRAHAIEVVASMRTGKREVRFDKLVVKPASRCAPLLFGLSIPGHELQVEEAISEASSEFRFALRVDGRRFNELPDADGALGVSSSSNNKKAQLQAEGGDEDEPLDEAERRLSDEVREARENLELVGDDDDFEARAGDRGATEEPATLRATRAGHGSRSRNRENHNYASSSTGAPPRTPTGSLFRRQHGESLSGTASSRPAIVAENALVALYQVQLEPGVFGTGILLRNEPCASRRIEVAAVAASATIPGVSPGDVLVAINGKPLPRGASATELQELVRSNPRYALTAVDALMWHKKTIKPLLGHNKAARASLASSGSGGGSGGGGGASRRSSRRYSSETEGQGYGETKTQSGYYDDDDDDDENDVADDDDDDDDELGQQQQQQHQGGSSAGRRPPQTRDGSGDDDDDDDAEDLFLFSDDEDLFEDSDDAEDVDPEASFTDDDGARRRRVSKEGARGGHTSVAGSELTINCGNGALGVEWARMVSTPAARAPHVDGVFAAVGIRGQALNLAVKPGDLLVGINHEPLPRDLPSATLLQRFSSAAARGPPTLNLWRCYDPTVLRSILQQCKAAKQFALAVNPSVSAHVPRRPRDAAARPAKSACC